MNRWLIRTQVFALLFALWGLPAYSVAEDEGLSEAAPSIADLGDERYRIGTITVDKAARTFSVGGKVLHLGKPLEYLAVKTEGSKAYESLLELESSAIDFQLACILVGLDDEASVKPRYQFDENEADGPAVELMISWEVDGNMKTVSAADALTAGDGPLVDAGWVYIGSSPSPQDGSLLAELSGTLIGFVHDPLAIIEHRTGAGAGSYGMITGNSEMLPAEGSPITLTVSVVTD